MFENVQFCAIFVGSKFNIFEIQMAHVDYHTHFMKQEVIFKFDSLVNVSLFIQETSISCGRAIYHLKALKLHIEVRTNAPALFAPRTETHVLHSGCNF